LSDEPQPIAATRSPAAGSAVPAELAISIALDQHPGWLAIYGKEAAGDDKEDAGMLVPVAKGEKGYMEEVEDFTKQILARDPNSFDGHRLMADIHYTKATEAFGVKNNETGRQQHNDRGNAEAARQNLGPGGECENQADPDQNLVCCHAGLR